MNSLKIKSILFLFAVIIISSCGKNYNCKCTAIATTKSGSTTTTTKIETVNSDRYRKQETARLMCENLKTMSASASATTESTCILE
jgi:Na+-transporting NADH:ubiquinone oxidoreductase subunit NqrF